MTTNNANENALDESGGIVFDNKTTIHHVAHLQSQLGYTKRILWAVSVLAVLMMCTIFGLTVTVVNLVEENANLDRAGHFDMPPVAREGNDDDDGIVIATVAEGFTIHHGDLASDPYGIATETSSLFSLRHSDAESDAYTCLLSDYLQQAKLLGQVEACRGVYYAAERAQTISFLSADEKRLARGQSMASLSLTPTQVWMDPIIITDDTSQDQDAPFNDETIIYMVQGTTGPNNDCRLLVFVEDLTQEACPYYEIPSCIVPSCISGLSASNGPVRPVFNN